jgi:predicted RNA-binding protein with PUA-like domain
MVDIQFRQKFAHFLALDALKHHPELSKMPLLRKGNRLSVLPVSSEEWEFIVQLAC